MACFGDRISDRAASDAFRSVHGDETERNARSWDRARGDLPRGRNIRSRGRPLAAAEAAAEKFNEDFILKRHPRTAIGTRSDGRLVIATVDGRQPQKSVGMTIDELTRLMVGLGCVEAINLDGGGSTTMVVKGKTVNNPSDPAGERPVSDALLVFRR